MLTYVAWDTLWELSASWHRLKFSLHTQSEKRFKALEDSRLLGVEGELCWAPGVGMRLSKKPARLEGACFLLFKKWLTQYFSEESLCVGLDVCMPPEFICRNITPSVTVLGGEAFGRWLGHLISNRISVLTEETPESSLASSTTWAHGKKMSMNQEAHSHQTLNL